METRKTENCMICELEHIPVSRLKCEHSHRNKQCSYADCRYFAVP